MSSNGFRFIWFALLLLAIVGFIVHVSAPEYSPSNPSEAHDLNYGDELVRQEEHERMMGAF